MATTKDTQSQDKSTAPRVRALADIEASDEFVTLQHLLAEAKVRSWGDAKIGRLMLKHFKHLQDIATSSNQEGECDICDHPITSAYDVAQNNSYIVHRACRSWPKNLAQTINKSLKAFDNN